MTVSIREFVDSGGQRLRVDRQFGVLRGVKLLGTVSKNGRRYRDDALREAANLYEGAKVNVNHPKGSPLAPRDYRDRLGVIRGVEFRSGEGLFGDLHFNPKHALSEQLAWDAEHEPGNVGLSHNVLAKTSRDGDLTTVEAITKVQSVDLVADPATTHGLYEQTDPEHVDPPQLPYDAKPVEIRWDALTVEQLELHRPDLVIELQRNIGQELSAERKRVDELAAREAVATRRERVLELLTEHALPVPISGSDRTNPIVSDAFFQSLMNAPDDDAVRALVEGRAALVRSAQALAANSNGRFRRPRSRDQLAALHQDGASRVESAAEFAVAVRG